jgi:hypothetical protein
MEWPTSTHLWCWLCTHPFDTVPIPVPQIYDERRQVFYVFGSFCSFACAKRYVIDRNIASHHSTLLTLMRRKLLGSLPSGPDAGAYSIRAAPPGGSLAVFGGRLSIDEFCAHGEPPLLKVDGSIGMVLTARPDLLDPDVPELGSGSAACISRTKVYRKDPAVVPKKRAIDKKASMRAIARSPAVPNSTYKLRRTKPTQGGARGVPPGSSLLSLLAPILQSEADVE